MARWAVEDWQVRKGQALQATDEHRFTQIRDARIQTILLNFGRYKVEYKRLIF
jgi:hypothetical protein